MASPRRRGATEYRLSERRLADGPALAKAAGVVLLLLGSASFAAAQTPAPPASDQAPPQPSSNPFEHIKFGATFEGYYQYNWNRPPEMSWMSLACTARLIGLRAKATAIADWSAMRSVTLAARARFTKT